jgi:hypothetical protein
MAHRPIGVHAVRGETPPAPAFRVISATRPLEGAVPAGASLDRCLRCLFVGGRVPGQTESQVHRLTLLKRQTHRRATFDLLSRRVLCHAP